MGNGVIGSTAAFGAVRIGSSPISPVMKQLTMEKILSNLKKEILLDKVVVENISKLDEDPCLCRRSGDSGDDCPWKCPPYRPAWWIKQHNEKEK